MFKKIALATVLFAFSTHAALADGIYAGVTGGMRDNIKDTRSYRGIEGNLFVGYGAMVNPAFYLSGELFGVPGSMSINNNGLKTTWGFGASLLPGMMISDHIMAYLRLGVVRTVVTDLKTTGGQVGLGLQTGLTQSWDLRAEYIYTAYNTVSHTIGAPRSDQANLALLYKFE